MLNVLIQCGCYKKIYDSYKHDDVYGALYQISLGLTNNQENEKRMHDLEQQLSLLSDDHVRIYMVIEGFMKQVMIKKSKKLVMVKWLMLQIPDDIESDEQPKSTRFTHKMNKKNHTSLT